MIDIINKPLQISNNITTNFTGTLLDASQGKLLNDSLVKLNEATIIDGIKSFSAVPFESYSNSAAERRIYFRNDYDYMGYIAVGDTTSSTETITNPLLFFRNQSMATATTTNTGFSRTYCFPHPATSAEIDTLHTMNTQLLTSNPEHLNRVLTSTSFVNTGISFIAYKLANWVCLIVKGTSSSAVSSGKNFGTLPVGYRPILTFRFMTTNNAHNKGDHMEVNTNGNIYARNSWSNGVGESGTAMFFTDQ